MSIDVLIYIEKVKEYFNNDNDVKNYFLQNFDEKIFFSYLTEVATINYQKQGDPALSKEQFETIRNVIYINKNDPESIKSIYLSINSKNPHEEKIFMNLNDFGFLCLN